MSALLQASALSLARGEKRVLNEASFTFGAGDIVVVLGPNGAGKSSLLLALAGLLPVQNGSIHFDTANLADLSRPQLVEKIAWQGDLPPTEFGLTVQQRLELADQFGDIESAASDMDISALLNRSLAELSSGERQRVELAALMLRDTPLWLLDEPTAHLDLKHQVSCLNLIKAQAENGRAVITVLHDLQQAAAVATHLLLLDGEGHASFGTAADMLNIETLSGLFDTPLLMQSGLIMPEYGTQP